MTAVSGGGGHDRLQDPVRIIHKDQEVISAFCINSVSLFIFLLLLLEIRYLKIFICRQTEESLLLRVEKKFKSSISPRFWTYSLLSWKTNVSWIFWAWIGMHYRIGSISFINLSSNLSYYFYRDPDSNASSYLVVQTPGDRHVLSQINGSRLHKLNVKINIIHDFNKWFTKFQVYLDPQVQPIFPTMLHPLRIVACRQEVLFYPSLVVELLWYVTL